MLRIELDFLYSAEPCGVHRAPPTAESLPAPKPGIATKGKSLPPVHRIVDLYRRNSFDLCQTKRQLCGSIAVRSTTIPSLPLLFRCILASRYLPFSP